MTIAKLKELIEDFYLVSFGQVLVELFDMKVHIDEHSEIPSK